MFFSRLVPHSRKPAGFPAGSLFSPADCGLNIARPQFPPL